MNLCLNLKNRDKWINISALDIIGTGGEGNIYDCPEAGCALKVFHSPEDSQAIKISRLKKCLQHKNNPFSELAGVAAIPIGMLTNDSIIVNTQGQAYLSHPVGYAMENCADWWNLTDLFLADFCNENGIGLRHKAWIFCEIHRAIQLIHGKGFVIGDLNASNILAKIENDRCQVRLIDTDGWGIDRPDLGLKFDPSALDNEIMHPKQLEANLNGGTVIFRQAYDWWAFAYLLTRCLVGKDPFFQGNYYSMSREERILNKISIWHGGIRLDRFDAISSVRIGPKLRMILKRFLIGALEGEFPIELLVDLYTNLSSCSHCSMAAHKSLHFCPNCATQL